MRGVTDNDLIPSTENEWSDLLSQLRVPAVRSKKEAWSVFEETLHGQRIVATKRSLNLWVYAIAAGVAILIGISWWFYFSGNTRIRCQPANTLTVFLPDSSQVVLNAASELSFNKNSWKADRKIKLKGEAFFSVRKGSRFEVSTGNGKIQVLGTRFNVYARDKHLNVYCETGKVAVIAGDTAFITAGLKAIAEKGSAVHAIIAEPEHETAWKKGEFWFSNAPLEDVIAELERQFSVTIHCQKHEKRYYSGYFNRNSLQLALKTVFSPLQLSYTIENKTIIIN